MDFRLRRGVVGAGRALGAVTLLALCACSGERDDGSPATANDGGATVADGRDAGATAPPACFAQSPPSCPAPAPSYGDVAPIFKERCAPCHSGVAGGPWPLSEYADISDWRDDVRSDLLSCSMPPADAGSPLRDDERQLILTWIRCGLPE